MTQPSGRDALTFWRKPPSVHRSYVEGRFGQVHLRTARPPGNPSARPVILMHQSPATGRVWEGVLAELGKDRICIAPDTPGFGDSDPPPMPPTIADYAAALGDLLDRMNLPKVDLAGDHTGTKIAIEFARQRPHQVHRMVLNAAMVFTDTETAMMKDTVEREKNHHHPVDGSHLPEQFKKLAKYYVADAPLDLITRDVAEGLRGGRLMWYGHNASFQFDVAKALKDVPHAIMLLIPDDGFAALARRTIEHLRNGKVVELPTWRMGAISQHAAELAGLMRTFLDSRDVEDPAHLPPGAPAPAAPKPLARGIRRRFLDTPQGQLHLREADATRPTKRALVCLHSSPMSSKVFEPLMRIMAADRRVVAFDTPGYGESDKPDGPLPIAGYAKWLHAGLVEAGLDDIDIVGDHTGAKIAIELALIDPARVHAIALNATAVYTPEERERYLKAVGPVPAAADGSHLVDLWRRARGFKAPDAPEDETADLFVEITRGGPGWWWASHGALAYPMEEKLPKLTQPVLFLLPGKDPLSGPARRAVPMVKHGTVRDLPDYGAGIMQTHADVIARELRAFFDR